LLPQLWRQAGDCEQRRGGERERQDVIECVERIATGDANDNQEQRRSRENGYRRVDERAGSQGSRAIHGPGCDTRR
jgi:hypothetical protein